MTAARLAIALALAALTGCLDAHTVTCGADLCPDSQVCSPIGGCVFASQLAACADPATTGCTLPDGSTGRCYTGVCLHTGCGNRIVDPGEACDDGNTLAGDGCSAACDSDESCGNGFVDSLLGEGCDCGGPSATGPRPAGCDDHANGDADDAPCTARCQLRGCGDGTRAGLEDCDGADLPLTACTSVGYYGGTLACLPTCRYDTRGCTGRCGDGVRDAALGREACDGGDLGGLDCTSFGYYAPAGLACDGACGFDLAGCTQRCGDGAFQPGHETCDPGETPAQLAARGVTCAALGFYGGGGRLACTAACELDTSGCTGGACGDGIVEGPEACDGAVPAGVDCTDVGFYAPAGLACRANCTFDTSGCRQRCGDGILDAPEDCDTTVPVGLDCTDLGFYAAGTLACGPACGFDTSGCGGRCGDGVLDGPEQCDGAALGGATCTDLGFYAAPGLACGAACTYDTTGCTGFCGDRAVTAPEELCDGAAASGESCVAYGFESGALGCTPGCGPDLAGCHQPWTVASALGFARTAMWGASATDLWVVGADPAHPIAHGDGATWHEVAAPATALAAVWGANATTVYAVGDAGAILRWNGAAWTRVAGTPFAHDLSGIWGASATDIFVVGDQGTIGHFDGTVWSAMTSPTTLHLRAVWGRAGNDVYAVGDTTSTSHVTLLHYDGAAWTANTQTFSPAGDLLAVTGAPSSGGAVIAVGRAGLAIEADTPPTFAATKVSGNDLTGLARASAGDYYAVDALGDVLHRGAIEGTWTSAATSLATELAGAWAASPSDFYAVGAGPEVVHFDGGMLTTSDADSDVWVGLWADRADDALAVSNAGDAFAQWDGSAWKALASHSTIAAQGLWAASATDAYWWELELGNGNNLYHWDGAHRTGVALPTANDVYAVWGTGHADVFAVGDRATVTHYDGSAWTATRIDNTLPYARFIAMWGSSDHDLYVTTSTAGVYEHFDGTAWSRATLGTTVWNAAWGSGPDDVYLIGTNAIAHRTNGAWSIASVPGTWYAIAGTGPSDIYVGGASAALVHYDGFAWSPVAIDSAADIHALLVTPGGTDLFVGSGIIRRRTRTCSTTETRCGDGTDDDCDGLVDCGDPDCAADAACAAGGACAGAVALACGTPVAGTTAGGATRLERYACDGFLERGREIAYRYVAGATGSVTAHLGGLARDLDLVALRTGAGGTCEPRAGGCLAASSSAGTADEQVTFAVTAGQTYDLVVDGFTTADAGTFTLELSCP